MTNIYELPTSLKYSFATYTEDGEELTRVTTKVPYYFYKKYAEDITTCHSYDATTKMATVRVPENLTARLDDLWTAYLDTEKAHKPVPGQVAMSLTAAKPAPAKVAVSVKAQAEDNRKWYKRSHDSFSVAVKIGTRYGMRWKVSVKCVDEQGNMVTLCQWFDSADEDRAALTCYDIDSLFEDATFNFVEESCWQGQKNGTFHILPF